MSAVTFARHRGVRAGPVLALGMARCRRVPHRRDLTRRGLGGRDASWRPLTTAQPPRGLVVAGGSQRNFAPGWNLSRLARAVATEPGHTISVKFLHANDNSHDRNTTVSRQQGVPQLPHAPARQG